VFREGRADAYLDKGDFDRALADFSEALQITPQSATGYAGRGFAERAKGDFDRAIADFNLAIVEERIPASPWGHKLMPGVRHVELRPIAEAWVAKRASGPTAAVDMSRFQEIIRV